MLRYAVLNRILSHKNRDDRGFTLAEMLVTVIVIGVFASVSIPAFVGLMNKNKVQEATDTLQAALQEVQKESMAQSINCELTIDGNDKTVTASAFIASYSGSTETITPVPGSNCLTKTYSLGDNISLTTNGSNTQAMKIRYSYKGNATSETTDTNSDGLPDPAIIVIDSTGNPDKKCLVVPDGVGIIRIGNYTGSTGADSSNCESD